MPYANYHAARMIEPDKFSNIVVLETLPNGVMIYGGNLKGEEKTTAQAYRFPKERFSSAQAKEWLKEHSLTPILFEPATIEKMDAIKDDDFYNKLNDLIMEFDHKLVIKMIVIEKAEKEKQFIYKLGYAVDGAILREGNNIDSFDVVSDKNIEPDTCVNVACKKIEAYKNADKWFLKMDGLKILSESSGKKPESVTEIIKRADSVGVTDNLIQTITAKASIDSNGEVIINREISLIKSEKKQIVYGVVYEPFVGDNIDAHGDYMTAEEVEKMAHKYLEDFAEVKFMHSKNLGNKARVVESYIAPADMTISGEKILKGAWIMAVKVYDKDLWKLIEAGEIQAFSIGGAAAKGKDLIKMENSKKPITKMNLIDAIIKEVSLVDRGANKKKFFLYKRGANQMDKEIAIEILKSGNVSEKVKAEILKGFSEEEITGINKALEEKPTAVNIDEIIEKAGAKFSKETAGAVQEVKDLIGKIQAIIAGLKPAEAKAEKPADDVKNPPPAMTDEEKVKKMIDNDEDIPDEFVSLATQILAKKFN